MRDGLVLSIEKRDGVWAAAAVLEGVSAYAIAAEDERVLLGTRGDGAYLSLHGGDS